MHYFLCDMQESCISQMSRLLQMMVNFCLLTHFKNQHVPFLFFENFYKTNKTSWILFTSYKSYIFKNSNQIQILCFEMLLLYNLYQCFNHVQHREKQEYIPYIRYKHKMLVAYIHNTILSCLRHANNDLQTKLPSGSLTSQVWFQ